LLKETTNELLKKAIDLHLKGDVSKAEAIYSQILDEEMDPKVLGYLGLLNYQRKNFLFAVRCINKSIEITNTNHEVYNILGLIFVETLNYKNAEICFRYALKIKPDFVEALNNYGILLCRKQNFKESLVYFDKALEIDSSYPEANSNKASALVKIGNLQEGIFYYKEALKYAPDYLLAIGGLGIVLAKMGIYQQASEYFLKYLNLKQDPLYLYYCGICFLKLNLTKQANNYLKAAAEKNPVFNYISETKYFKEIDLLETQIKMLKEISDQNPDNLEVYKNLAGIFTLKQDFDKAAYYYRKIIKKNNTVAKVFYNLGDCLIKTNKPFNAFGAFKKAVELDPNFMEAHYDLGGLYLLNGDFETGFKEYEWRYKIKYDKFVKEVLKLSGNSWDGTPIEGKTLYIHWEQGIGDSLIFVRYLKQLVSIGIKIKFKPPKELTEIIARNFPEIDIIDFETKDSSIEFDEYTSIFSIPNLLKASIKNIPYSEGYINAESSKVEEYREKYFNNKLLKIGIFWQGNPVHENDRNRSIQLEEFLPIKNFQEVKLYSFQKWYGLEQLILENDPEIVDLGSTFNNFDDTAAALQNLDLFITVDSAIAHLSGAMGKKTWIITPCLPEWRWFLNIDTSPWYNSVKLFRPSKSKDWQKKILSRIIEELNNEINLKLLNI
jgi:tetratricopeptide (TPR) repeat protein